MYKKKEKMKYIFREGVMNLEARVYFIMLQKRKYSRARTRVFPYK